jgi:hypothetical protein
MTRAVQILFCAVVMTGCARMVEVPLEPVEMAEPPPAATNDEPAPIDEGDEGVAGMSGGPELPVTPSDEPPPAEETPVDVPDRDAVCEGLAKLAARDGAITFNADGSATVSVFLENVTDQDMFEYPGINVRWEVQHRYAAGEGGDLLLYGLFAGQRWEHTFQAPADVLERGAGGLMIVHAEPFTLSSRYPDAGCESRALEFSAIVP